MPAEAVYRWEGVLMLVGNWCDYGLSLTAACSSVPAEAVYRWEGVLRLVGNWCDYGPSLTAACSSVPALWQYAGGKECPIWIL